VGKLSFGLPADMDAVNGDIGDIPSYEEDSSNLYVNENGDTYEYGFGLSYNDDKKGGELPKKASNMYSLLAFGVILTYVGALMFFILQHRSYYLLNLYIISNTYYLNCVCKSFLY